MTIGFQKIGLNEEETFHLCQASDGGRTYDPYIKTYSSVIQFAVFTLHGSCHCLNKTSVPYLTLFSCEFIMLNQLLPQQPCYYKHELKALVSIRKIRCSGEVSLMYICILFRGNGNNFHCVLFLFQVVLLLIFTTSYSY